jgi:hypothetical protein
MSSSLMHVCDQFPRTISLRSEASVDASVRSSLHESTDPSEPTLLTAIVFENERCMLSEWSCDNLMHGVDWPPWSDTTGIAPIESLHDIDVLPGYEWMDSWHVDKLRGKTDCEGFYYASSFPAMGKLLEIKKASTDRRRSSMRRGSHQRAAMDAVLEEGEEEGEEAILSRMRALTDASDGDSGGEDHSRVLGMFGGFRDGSGSGSGSGNGAMGGNGSIFVRTRKWLRHMVRHI